MPAGAGGPGAWVLLNPGQRGWVTGGSAPSGSAPVLMLAGYLTSLSFQTPPSPGDLLYCLSCRAS